MYVLERNEPADVLWSYKLISIQCYFLGDTSDPIREKNRQKIALLLFDAKFGTQEEDRFWQSLAEFQGRHFFFF